MVLTGASGGIGLAIVAAVAGRANVVVDHVTDPSVPVLPGDATC